MKENPAVATFDISTHILTKRMTASHSSPDLPVSYFNSHPHEEDDHMWPSLTGGKEYFNSHPHEEDDDRIDRLAGQEGYFNSHPHEEDDSSHEKRAEGEIYFNSHPHEEDDTIQVSNPLQLFYFNSHPHEEDDSGHYLVRQGDGISTHILTKRMTKKKFFPICRLAFQLTSSRRG